MLPSSSRTNFHIDHTFTSSSTLIFFSFSFFLSCSDSLYHYSAPPSPPPWAQQPSSLLPTILAPVVWRQLAACLGYRTYFSDLHPHLLRLVTVVPSHPVAEVAGRAIADFSIEAGAAICLHQVRRGGRNRLCRVRAFVSKSIPSPTRINVHFCVEFVCYVDSIGCARNPSNCDFFCRTNRLLIAE